ncbi:hypothetical protein [Phenylobacterium sp.]|uniref:hypothetical protein n=1 Tax=Phenylobacterium sp. TaxID=1871053 RepID=UPI0025F3F1C9|nr:hypothetical protein [Phenylobacterium sp.]MBX3482729.1 hypothetical protein [Phenylobacterium sp.]
MRNVLVPAALAASLALGPTAFAAAPAPKPAPAAARTAAPHGGKQQACEAAWTAQKSHTGTRAAFMKACVSKG